MKRQVYRGESVGGIEGLAELLNAAGPEWHLHEVYYRGPDPEDGYDVLLYTWEGA